MAEMITLEPPLDVNQAPQLGASAYESHDSDRPDTPFSSLSWHVPDADIGPRKMYTQMLRCIPRRKQEYYER